jgi:hypothetical protein
MCSATAPTASPAATVSMPTSGRGTSIIDLNLSQNILERGLTRIYMKMNADKEEIPIGYLRLSLYILFVHLRSKILAQS